LNVIIREASDADMPELKIKWQELSDETDFDPLPQVTLDQRLRGE
jgi:hypothetical protein